MRYIYTGGQVIPKHCKYGPRPAEGIVFNNYEWWSITDHLVKEQREKEMAAVQRAKEEGKKEISFEMTRNWTNTLASIKTLGNQKRLEKMEKEKQDKIDEYNEILKNRKEAKKEMIANAKRVLYEDKDTTKTINSAIMYSVVLQDRQKQIEMKNSLKKDEAKKEFEEAEKYRRNAEEFKREKIQEKIEERAKRNFQRQILDTQMLDVKERRKLEAEEFEKEKQDLINMKIEADKIQHCMDVEKNYRKEFAARFCKKTDNQLEFERKLVLEQEEEDEINKLYRNYAKRFQDERKQREEQALKEKIEQRLKVTENLAKALREAARKEEERLEAAFQEKEKQAEGDEENKERLRKENLAMILESKRLAEERMAREQYETKEQKKWELMQIYRSAEVDEEWRKSEQLKKKEMMAQTRANYDAQVKETNEIRAKDLKEWLTPLEDETGDREELLKYCKDAEDFVKEHNMPSYPVLKAIAEIKKQNDIWDEKRPVLVSNNEPCNREKDSKKVNLGHNCYYLKY